MHSFDEAHEFAFNINPIKLNRPKLKYFSFSPSFSLLHWPGQTNLSLSDAAQSDAPASAVSTVPEPVEAPIELAPNEHPSQPEAQVSDSTEGDKPKNDEDGDDKPKGQVAHDDGKVAPAEPEVVQSQSAADENNNNNANNDESNQDAKKSEPEEVN